MRVTTGITILLLLFDNRRAGVEAMLIRAECGDYSCAV